MYRTFDSGRKIVVAWAEPWNKTNLLKSTMSTATTTVQEDVHQQQEEEESTMICMENPQERTPESTLNHQESQSLQEAALLLKKSGQKEMMMEKNDHYHRFQSQSHEGENPQEYMDTKEAQIAEILRQGLGGGAQHKQMFHQRSISQPTISFTESAFWKKIE